MTISILILALLAGVVLYQLYALLGRRIGRMPSEPNAAGVNPGAARSSQDPALDTPAAQTALQALRSWDQGFDVAAFLTGARSAYERVVKAFASGDRETLTPLLAPGVMASFEDAMNKREREGRSEAVEFLVAPRADLDSAKVEGDLARIAVRFLAELRSRSKGPEGEAVDDRRTAEIWSFERSQKSRDPNWILVRVDVAAT